MEHTNPLLTTTDDPFIVGESDFRFIEGRPYRCPGGAILFCTTGQAKVLVNMHQGELRPNSLIFLLPDSILLFNELSDDFRMMYCIFSLELFAEAVFRIEPAFFHFLSNNPISQRIGNGVHGLDTWLQMAAYTYADRDNIFRRTIIRNRLENVFLEIYDKLRRTDGYTVETGTGRRREVFQRFMSLVREQCTLHREVAFYADKLCISARYLSSIARSISHKSPKELIDEFSILEIKVLLQSTRLSVQEIAYRLRFPDQSYMGHYFRRHTGYSPSEYRNQQ